MRAPAGGVWLVVPALMAGMSVARAADAPVAWRGFMNCGIIPGLTHYNLHKPITVVVAGTDVSLERHVLRADTTQELPYVERVVGTLAPDATVTLTGGAVVGRKLSYSATYAGRLPQSGGATRLIGSQIWVGDPVGRFERPCHLDLSR